MRCETERRLHVDNCFITLTYNDDAIPDDGGLHKPHLQRFFKRLRKRKGKFRYYACGEYGDSTKRPHYHACIFGMDFKDKIHFKTSGGHKLYISKELNEIWGHGLTSIGELNFDTAAYTARYVMKKQTGKQAGYHKLDEQTGELTQLENQFAVMSLKPAIGRTFIEKFYSDIYHADKDFLFMRGQKMRPPRYFDKIYDTIDPDRFASIKKQRYDNTEGLTNIELDARARIACAREKSKSTF